MVGVVFGITPALENQTGPWLGIAVGALWLVMLVLLIIHTARRRSGYYSHQSDNTPPPRAFLWTVDAALFLLVCFLAYLAVRFFAPVSISWYFRVGILSGVFAVIGILIILREGLSLQIAAARERQVRRKKSRRGKKTPK